MVWSAVGKVIASASLMFAFQQSAPDQQEVSFDDILEAAAERNSSSERKSRPTHVAKRCLFAAEYYLHIAIDDNRNDLDKAIDELRFWIGVLDSNRSEGVDRSIHPIDHAMIDRLFVDVTGDKYTSSEKVAIIVEAWTDCQVERVLVEKTIATKVVK